MLFEGKFSVIDVEDVVEVAKGDFQTETSLYVTHKSGAKTTTKYGTSAERDADYSGLVECMRKVHGNSIVSGSQAPR